MSRRRRHSDATVALAALDLDDPAKSSPSRDRKLFACESCAKVYRHPSCLIKHRWEHTPQWHEASKFVLSKHQQVQLLEAAAILSHLSPTSASLPEDRSLWPAFLSGGLVPPPASSSLPTPAPDDALNLLALRAGTRTHARAHSYSHPRRRLSLAYDHRAPWSLPRSALRSHSRSPSQSACDSRCDDDLGAYSPRLPPKQDAWDGLEMEMEMD